MSSVSGTLASNESNSAVAAGPSSPARAGSRAGRALGEPQSRAPGVHPPAQLHSIHILHSHPPYGILACCFAARAHCRADRLLLGQVLQGRRHGACALVHTARRDDHTLACTAPRRTLDRPTPPVLAHMATLAASCFRACSQLLQHGLPRPAAPPPHDGADGEGDEEDGSGARQEAFEAALLGALFTPQLQHYDVLLHLRSEALPLSGHGLPAWLVGAGGGGRRRQPDVLTGPLLEEELQAASALHEGGGGGGGGGEDGDSLAALLGRGGRRRAAGGLPPPAKRARAFLDAFPAKVRVCILCIGGAGHGARQQQRSGAVKIRQQPRPERASPGCLKGAWRRPAQRHSGGPVVALDGERMLWLKGSGPLLCSSLCTGGGGPWACCPEGGAAGGPGAGAPAALLGAAPRHRGRQHGGGLFGRRRRWARCAGQRRPGGAGA